MPVEPLPNRFYAPEGRYALYSERQSGLQYFSSSRATKLTFVEPLAKAEGHHVVFNVQDLLHICNYSHTGKPPRRSVLFAGGGNGGSTLPTCHDFYPAADGYDLLVGFGTGDVALLSLQAQIQAGATNNKPVQLLQYGPEGPVDPTKCTAVCFIPGSEGTVFAAAHLSGTVIIHIKGKEANSNKSSFSLKALSSGPQRGPTTPLFVSKEGVNAMAVSPDGKHLATASRDGITRVFDLATAQLSGGFKSYFGGVCCVCWSPDGRYIAAGGEDDLVSIYGVAERGLVAWGQGHSSWVMQVAFDPWQCEAGSANAAEAQVRTTSGMLPLGVETTYRVGSVGQDCQLLLWDFVIADDYSAAMIDPGLNATAASNGSYGSGQAAATASTSRAGSGSSGSGAFDTSGGHRRKGSFGTPTHRHKASNGSRDFNAPDLIAPSVPRAEMILSAPVVQQKIHHEPLTDVLFSQYAMYTADACGQVRCWQRPTRPQTTEQSPEAAQSAQSATDAQNDQQSDPQQTTAAEHPNDSDRQQQQQQNQQQQQQQQQQQPQRSYTASPVGRAQGSVQASRHASSDTEPPLPS